MEGIGIFMNKIIENIRKLKQIKGAIFDLDGTLLDSMGVWSDVDRIFFARRGMEVPKDFIDRKSVV